jgi:hypothetical protein
MFDGGIEGVAFFDTSSDSTEGDSQLRCRP